MEVEKLVRENIRKLKPYASARSEFKGSADVFLDANENPFETGLNRYPDPLQWKLKEKISEIKRVPVEQIFLGNGSDEVIDLLIRIFCEPGTDHIITLPPTYGMYRVSASIANVEIRKIALSKNFQPDVDTILTQSNSNSKLLFLCSPNNPTGNSFDLGHIQTLAEGFPGIVVVDEAYIDFSKQESSISLLKDYSNLVVMQTFSKAWGLAGIRLGMAFTSESIIGFLNNVKPPYNVNQLTQEVALKSLAQIEKTKGWVKNILIERSALKTTLNQLDFVEHIYPSDANFLLVKMAAPKGVYQYLVEQGVIVRDRSKVLLCEGCLRITVGRPEENEKLMECLSDYQT